MSESQNKVNTIDERFTAIADSVTQWVGKWWFTVISLLLLILWILYGVFIIGSHAHDWFTSNAFNFPLNTVTTVGEWFLEGLILAAANRVERRHELLLKEIKGHTRADEATTKRDADVNRKSESEIQQMQRDLEFIKRQLAKLVVNE